MKRIDFLFVFLCLLLSSCYPVKEIAVKQITLSEESNIVHDSLLFGKCEVVSLELMDEALINHVDKILLFDDKIAVADLRSCAVFIFDNSGRFLYKIKHVGNGPGEYVQLLDVCLDRSKSSFAFLTSPTAVMFYDYNGKFLHKMEIDNLPMEMVVGDRYIYFLSSDQINLVNQDDALRIMDRKTGEITPLLEQGVIPVRSLWTRGHSLTPTEDGGYFVQRYTNRIYKMTGDTCSLLFQLDLGKYNLPEDLLMDNVGREHFENQYYKGKYIFSLVNLSEVNNGFLFTSDRQGFFYYKIKEDKLFYFKSIFNSTYKIDFNDMIPVEGSEKKIAFIKNENQISSLKKNRPRNETPVLKQLLDSLPEESNPVLFLYDVKK